jgi:cardiolipin synthase
LSDYEFEGSRITEHLTISPVSFYTVVRFPSLISQTALQYRYIPNLITGLRILLVAPILMCLVRERYAEALMLFIVAGCSDVLDGYLAKHNNWTTRLGGILDPLADKLLLMGTILTLGVLGALPVWLVALVIVRDVVIVGGALSYHYLIERFQAAPLAISKLNTLMQLTLVLSALFSKAFPALPEELLMVLIIATTLTTLASGIAYVWQWGRRALERRKQADSA